MTYITDINTYICNIYKHVYIIYKNIRKYTHIKKRMTTFTKYLYL